LFLHVLDDLWDFHTKSLFLVFNFWEAENLLFLVFNVSGATGTQMEKGKLHSWFFIGRTAVGRRSKGGEPRGPKGGGGHAARCFGRVGPTIWSLGHFLAWGFLTRSPSRPKSNALIFTRLSEVAAAAKLLIPSEGDQILLLRSSGEGGNHRHRHHLSSLAWEEASTSSPSPRPAPSPSSSP
jgi:hypothetical protein